MNLDNSQRAFFALLRAGLWEKDVQLSPFGDTDYGDVYRIAEEQSVIGLVAAGIEHVVDVKIPQELVLQFVGQALQLEQRNLAMNRFLASLMEKLREEDVYVVLVKGQGIAQCYVRPLWRSAGDIDLLLSEANYQKAKDILLPIAVRVEQEYSAFKHLGMTMKGGFDVELHGTLHSRLSKRIDKVIDAVQDEIFYSGSVRSWMNERTQVFLPSPDADIIFVFTHFLHHFFFGGVGLRQICDWCRLLWTYRDRINVSLLEKRIHKMQLMSEWRVFAAYAVDYIGMPSEAMPLYSFDDKWRGKARRINDYVLKVGNFGHNQESPIKTKQPYLLRKFISFWVHLGYILCHFKIFPLDSILFFGQVFRSGLHSVIRGE